MPSSGETNRCVLEIMVRSIHGLGATLREPQLKFDRQIITLKARTSLSECVLRLKKSAVIRILAIL